MEEPNGQPAAQHKHFNIITTGVPADHFLSYTKGGIYRLDKEKDKIGSQIKNEKYTTRFLTPITNPAEFQECTKQRNLTREYLQLTHSINMRKMHILPGFIAQLITVYLGDLSNVEKVKEHINRWVTNGYIVCMEGLLSSIGKELGMIQVRIILKLLVFET